MTSIDHKRSLQLELGSVSRSTSTDTLAPSSDTDDDLEQSQLLHKPIPPACEKPELPRPFQGHSSSSKDKDTRAQGSVTEHNLTTLNHNGEMAEHTWYPNELKTKADESCFNMGLLLDLVTRAEDLDKLLLAEPSVTGNTIAFTNQCVSIPSSSQSQLSSVYSNVDAEKVRKKKKKKERESKKSEKAEKAEQKQLEEERMMKEISRNRSMFNRNKSTLPAIGMKCEEANTYNDKLPEVETHEFTKDDLRDNNIIDVIRKHETRVREATHLREISQNFIIASAGVMEPKYQNEVIDIIEKHEYENSRIYGRLHGNYTIGGQRAARDCEPTSARSTCSLPASRRGAA
ncbi:uncharacterized protein LOC132720777 [Ruditapes philippinarum]|uniref:uncharacterized protein LOC132720777 n=1 Tax=Ruditapes philippinarum TaxID=129788 RepID=UPI00295BD3F7|nr:uncharacterized protein LOC132720777 [Ruditapes philippinarum]